MKSYKLAVNLLLIAAICIVSASCNIFNARDRTYQGPPQVEFFPLKPAPVETDGPVSIKAQLIGAQRSSDLTLKVVVVDSLTTAAANVYSLPSPSEVTIPADSSSAAFTFTVTPSNIQDGQNKVLTLELQGTNEVKAAPNLNKSTITIRP